MYLCNGTEWWICFGITVVLLGGDAGKRFSVRWSAEEVYHDVSVRWWLLRMPSIPLLCHSYLENSYLCIKFLAE